MDLLLFFWAKDTLNAQAKQRRSCVSGSLGEGRSLCPFSGATGSSWTTCNGPGQAKTDGVSRPFFYLLRASRTSTIRSANRRPASSASSGEFPAAPTSTSSDPVVACWLYREFRSSTGRIKVG